MDTTSAIEPKTMAELLPCLSGILTRDTVETLTAKKQPRRTIAPTRTTEKVLKPLTIAEMRADLQALRKQSPRRCTQTTTSNKKKNWNSSVKIERKISHTADGKLKNNPVRKVLNFQPGTKITSNSKMTMNKHNLEAPKFPKPEFPAKKSLHLKARDIIRISGVSNISETPNIVNKPNKPRITLADKENISKNANLIRKPLTPPIVLNHKLLNEPTVPDTPLSNESWESSCDGSFLQNEKRINDMEEKAKAISEEPTLENIAEVTPPVSTPFKEYRNVQEYFNNSSELESSSMINDNTIMCFDKPSVCQPDKREEAVIVSLCDLLIKTKVTNTGNSNTELDTLIKNKKQVKDHIKVIENAIQALQDIKTSQIMSLQSLRKLIIEKKNSENLLNEHDITLTNVDDVTHTPVKNEKTSPEKSHTISKPCSVTKTPLKSPSYKIPKKNLCLRKKVFHKSMPYMLTPNKDMQDSRALNMYMKMKEQMNFLNTPVVKQSNVGVPDTPAVTSHNLQRQLDKLYGGS